MNQTLSHTQDKSTSSHQTSAKPAAVNTPFEQAAAHTLDALLKAQPNTAIWRQQAYDRFVQHGGLPTRKLEAWRNEDLRRLSQTSWSTPWQPNSLKGSGKAFLPSTNVLAWTALCPDSVHLVFVNGHWVEALSRVPSGSLSGVQPGVQIQDLGSLIKKGTLSPNILNAGMLTTQEPVKAGTTKAFGHLNDALFDHGLLITLAPGTVLNQPLELTLIQQQLPSVALMSMPRIVVRAQAGASLSLVLRLAGQLPEGHSPEGHAEKPSIKSALSAIQNGVITLELAEEAVCNLVVLDQQPEGSQTFVQLSALQQKNSQLHATTVCMGQGQSRYDLAVTLDAPGAEATLNGLNVLQQNAQAYHHSVFQHQAEQTTSHQYYKSIAEGQSITAFDGMIVVAPNAQQTDAEQLNKTLLLSDEAQVYTRPQLQIDADNVKCAHGATVGQLEDNELFYLTSRGLAPETARCLLTYGFAEAIIQAIPIVSVQPALERLLLAKLDHEKTPISCNMSCTEHAGSCL